MSGEFVYYEHEGAYFRRPAKAPGVGVRDVLHGDKWVPYDSDDLLAPVMFGNKVDESEVEGLPKEGADGEKVPG